MHYRRVKSHLVHYGRIHFASFGLTAHDDFLALDKSENFLNFAFGNDVGVVVAQGVAQKVKPSDIFQQFFNKFFLDALMHDAIVGSDAGLSRVEKFTPGNSFCRQIYVCVPVHHAGRLAAQLQHARNEVFRLYRANLFCEVRATRVKHKVEFLFE